MIYHLIKLFFAVHYYRVRGTDLHRNGHVRGKLGLYVYNPRARENSSEAFSLLKNGFNS